MFTQSQVFLSRKNQEDYEGRSRSENSYDIFINKIYKVYL